MDKIWTGRFSKELDETAARFNNSLPVDKRMYRQDILGSIAHAAMLGQQEIISEEDAEAIISGLEGILADIDSGALVIEGNAEDIHSFVETELTARIGDAGRRLHTGRSRNDQVATDLRLYLRERCEDIHALLEELIRTLARKAEEYSDAIMPGYTHLQRAQPLMFGHHLLAYCQMFLRDRSRFEDAARRMNRCPLGAGALAGATFPIDRDLTSDMLGFDEPCSNSMDAVSDRDFCLELASCCSIAMAHLSRLAEELILWCSWEFRFVKLDDAFATGSSMMPQKKNPDMAELIRGKSGRVFGRNMALLTMVKGLPLTYNKDLQEDKEAIFDCMDTLADCLRVAAPMIATMTADRQRMRQAAAEGFINATDLADYLVGKGLPFRTAYKLVGELVARCEQEGTTLERLPLSVYREYSDLFGEDLYPAIDLDACAAKRQSLGGGSKESVLAQLQELDY